MMTRRIAHSLAGIMVLAYSGLANAACYGPQQQLPAATVSGFLGNPGQLLSQFPNGGAQLISQVRDLVASDPAALQAVMGLLANAGTDQLSAIGSGLGQAARICSSRDQPFATQIQQAVGASGNREVNDAYAAVTLNVPIGGLAAGGAGGGGGGSGTGGPTAETGLAGGGITGPILGSFGTANGFRPLSGVTLSGTSSTGVGTTTTATTANTSVSPF